MKRALRSSVFWIPFVIAFLLAELFFAWELGYFINYLPSYPRPYATHGEVIFTGIIGLLLAINIGLIFWQRRFGHCPIGVKRLSGLAGVLGAFTLICPLCVLLPASFVGVGFFFASFAQHVVFMRIISIVILVISMGMLWPRPAGRTKKQDTSDR